MNTKSNHFINRDKAGRSIPAPGRGVLTIGRQASEAIPPPSLDLGYRARQLAFRRKQISQWIANEHEMLREEIALSESQGKKVDQAYIASREADIELEARRQEKSAQATIGMLEGADSRVAPLRRALAVWGLSADDIGVVSIHGTSTKANVRAYLSVTSSCLLMYYTGGKRDPCIQRYLHLHWPHSRQRCSRHGPEESHRPRKGWCCSMAAYWFDTNRQQRYYPWQQECR